MSAILRRGGVSSTTPDMRYAALAPKVAWLRSTLLPPAALDALYSADFSSAVATLSKTAYGSWIQGILQAPTPEKVFNAVRTYLLSNEREIILSAPEGAKAYLEAYVAHWEADDIKMKILNSFRAGYSQLKATVDSLPASWKQVRDLIEQVEKAGDTGPLSAAVDRAYAQQLVNAFNRLTDGERTPLYAFVETLLSWSRLKAELIAKKYSFDLSDYDFGFADRLKFDKELEGLSPSEALSKGETIVASILQKWAQNQAHANQFSPAPAQAVFYLKEKEGAQVARALISRLYGVSPTKRPVSSCRFFRFRFSPTLRTPDASHVSHHVQRLIVSEPTTLETVTTLGL